MRRDTVSIKVFALLQTKVHYYCTEIHSCWKSKYNSRAPKLFYAGFYFLHKQLRN